MEYETPKASEHQMFIEGVLCVSSAEWFEAYGADPDEEDAIF